MFIIEVDGYKNNELENIGLNRYNSVINALYRNEYGIVLYGNGLGKTFITQKLLDNNIISNHQIFNGINDNITDNINKLIDNNSKYILVLQTLDNIPTQLDSIYTHSVFIHFSN